MKVILLVFSFLLLPALSYAQQSISPERMNQIYNSMMNSYQKQIGWKKITSDEFDKLSDAKRNFSFKIKSYKSMGYNVITQKSSQCYLSKSQSEIVVVEYFKLDGQWHVTAFRKIN